MGWVQENIEIFMESNKDAFITFVHKSKGSVKYFVFLVKITPFW